MNEISKWIHDKEEFFYGLSADEAEHGKDDLKIRDTGDHIYDSNITDHDRGWILHRELCGEGGNRGGQSGTSDHILVSGSGSDGFHRRRSDRRNGAWVR